MTYIEQVRLLAIEKGLDPDKVEDDLYTAALAMNGRPQEIARAFVIAAKWQVPIVVALLLPELEA